jgi:uncharacterized membrane protein YraQ (UPF0718 family)
MNAGSGISTRVRSLSDSIHLAKALVYGSIAFIGVDTIYKITFGISHQTREKCLLFTSLPRWLFLLYENFIELIIIVILGVFAAALIERYFYRLKGFCPKNPVAAFVFAAIIPVCSCGAVPIIKSLNGRVPFRTAITFILAAPLLNPYIIVLSVTVLGIEYAILRVICSFTLAISVGYIAEISYKRFHTLQTGFFNPCSIQNGCRVGDNDTFRTTLIILKKLLPFLALAAGLNMVLELLGPGQILKGFRLTGNIGQNFIAILVGIPIYFCNGADVLFLKPLINQVGLPVGSAMAFSLTSTSICITSLVLLVRYVGTRLTTTILISLVAVTLLLSQVLNAMQNLQIWP